MDALGLSADVGHHLADVLRADDGRRCLREGLLPPRGELRVPAHRVLELGAVRLDDVAPADRLPDGAAQQHVVDEDEIGRKVLPHGRRVGRDPGVQLRPSGILDALDLVAVVLVDDEDREESAHVGAHRLGASEVEPLGVRLLGEQDDVVALPTPFAGELARVDVRARPSEEVAVPDEDPHHGTAKPLRSIISGIVTNS